jgi:septal ring factor EnvC (AmiA/AmiB activator)
MAEPLPEPQLTVIEEAAPRDDRDEKKRDAKASASSPGTAAHRPRRAARVWTLLLVAAVVVLGMLLASQLRYAGQLEARVEEIATELAEARESLGVYQQRMRSVRRNVDELASRVGALQALVSEDSLSLAGSAIQGVDEATPAPLEESPGLPPGPQDSP